MFDKKNLKEKEPKMKCESCLTGQHLLKIPNLTMENVNNLGYFSWKNKPLILP